jgi:diaminobutyrate-2-oxoglutarate transaminase
MTSSSSGTACLPASTPAGISGQPAPGAAAGVLSRQRARESSARTYARSFPIVPVRAQGMEVVDADGRRYLDCLAGAGTLEAVVKLMQTSTGRQGLLAFTGAYHGMTAGALAVTGSVAVKSPLPLGVEVTRLPYPYEYRCPFGIGGPDSARLSAVFIERLLDDPCGGVIPPAAMIVETVQGEGGAIPAPDGWLREMRRITMQRDIPLIVDEVQTGLGRTGAMWVIEHSGIEPDALVLSKAIGGSLPLAVIVYRDDYDGWLPGAHTGTFRGNTLAMAAGTATIRLIAEESLAERAAEVGRSILDRLAALGAELPVIGDVRGRGLMIGVELVDSAAEPDQRGALPPAPRLAARVRAACLERGLIVEIGGRHGAVVRLLPPLNITDEQCEAVLKRLADAIRATVSAGGPA